VEHERRDATSAEGAQRISAHTQILNVVRQKLAANGEEQREAAREQQCEGREHE
jgi:hypothetical protein